MTAEQVLTVCLIALTTSVASSQRAAAATLRVADGVKIYTENGTRAGGFAVGVDNRYAVYVGAGGGLYSVPLDGSAAPTLLDGRSLTFEDPDISRDGSHVAYLARQGGEDQGSVALYLSPIGGGGAALVGGPLNFDDATGDVGDFSYAFDPAGDYLAFTETVGSALTTQTTLFSVTLADGSKRTLDTGLGSGGFNGDAEFSADGRWLAYRTVQPGTPQAPLGSSRLHSVRPGGGAPNVLDNDPGNGFSLAVTPDSRTLLYLTSRLDLASGQTNAELRATPIDGSGIVTSLFNGPGLLFGSVLGLAVSPDSRWVVFALGFVNDEYKLHSIDLTDLGRPARLLSVADQPVVFFDPLGAISADSRRVVFTRVYPDDTVRVFSAPVDGSAAAADLSVDPDRLAILTHPTLDSERVVFGQLPVPPANATAAERLPTALYSAPIDGGSAAVRLDVAPSSGRIRQVYPPVPGGGRVVFIAGDKLFDVPGTGGTPVDLSTPASGGAEVLGFLPTADASRVIYQADAGLWVVDLSGGGAGNAVFHSDFEAGGN